MKINFAKILKVLVHAAAAAPAVINAVKPVVRAAKGGKKDPQSAARVTKNTTEVTPPA